MLHSAHKHIVFLCFCCCRLWLCSPYVFNTFLSHSFFLGLNSIVSNAVNNKLCSKLSSKNTATIKRQPQRRKCIAIENPHRHNFKCSAFYSLLFFFVFPANFCISCTLSCVCAVSYIYFGPLWSLSDVYAIMRECTCIIRKFCSKRGKKLVVILVGCYFVSFHAYASHKSY